ncbi:methyl-accepting chemotaxis protein [Magnetospirillum sulfuroxidans]|uniref:HAMP domain-containing protein n=1 Tax=Magnetospirillum sulfuroxidans TaxID=611300 RepID=A0ABS5IBG6_9PROT|nr:HAMP domain-containing methyl-accepting chemotaxis protein [Magnetospirillum sulfuroxidans]MBR9971611.1 HAMP domain-containing protein [Magnetospirillum sulfuroxidans]
MAITINTLSIRAKIALAPGLLIALLLLLVSYGLYVMTNSARHMAYERELATRTTQAANFANMMLMAQSNLYRMVSIASMEDNPDKITKLATASAAEIDALTPKLKEFQSMATELGLEAAKIDAGMTDLGRFIKSTKVVTDMVDSDVGTALTMMSPVDRNFEKAHKSLDALVTTIDRLSTAASMDAASAIATARWTFLVAAMVAVVAAITLTLRLSTRISTPIKSLTTAMRHLEQRNYDTIVSGQELRDEIGEMARSVQSFKQALIKVDHLAAEQEAEKKIQMDRADRIASLSREFEILARNALDEVSAASQQMQSTSQAMSAIATQTQDQASAVSVAAEQTSLNVQTVAAATGQLSASIGEISVQVQQASTVAQGAVAEAARVDGIVNGLNQAVTKIDQVVGLITNIASQTNLLALNATIEAARAGEAGKGFAVVAGEVKALANQTGRATTEITTQIGAVQAASNEAVQALSGIARTIERISDISANIAAAVEQQGAATQEITRSVQQAAEGTDAVTQNIGGVTRASQQTGAAANDVLSAANALAEQSSHLDQRVSAFLSAVQAA